MDDLENEQIKMCSSCEWCVVEVNSDGKYVNFCICTQSEKYLEPVSLLEDCEAWEEEKLFE